MNGDEHRALASLLLFNDAARTEMVLRSLIASPAGGARVCTSLVDVLLSFDLRGARPSPVTRDALLRAAFDHQHLLPVWTPHQRLLQVLLVRVLGCDPGAIEITEGLPDRADDDYYLASRCAAARLTEPAIARTAIETARDCCRYLHGCEYLLAMRALGALAAAAPGPALSANDELQRFRAQASAYLAGVVSIHPVPDLLWEWRLCEYAA